MAAPMDPNAVCTMLRKMLSFSRVLDRYRLGCAGSRFLSKKSYAGTVLLPKTSFPQRLSGAKRSQRDDDIAKFACFSEHYQWQQEHNKGPDFVFHDGPPYANGDTHLGHAVNKILKDITIRYRSLRGDRVHFVPGWDCHGLPIEVKALTSADVSASPTQIRSKARKFATATIEKQMQSFQHWGVMADWSKPYRTYDAEYIAEQLRAFYDLYEKGCVFRDHKPVYWSPSNKTALAEAELEYNPNHQSHSVFVAFPLVKIPEAIKAVVPQGSEVSVLIWTTTPWTLPANQAVCFSTKHKYSIVRTDPGGKFLVVASEMVSQVKGHLALNANIVLTFEGADTLSGATYSNPLHPGKEFPLVPGDHVTMDKGTGLVHSAPNHGFEDFQNALKHGITPEECLVDEAGCFAAGSGDALEGLSVLTEGSEAVLATLGDYVLHRGVYTHSYPYDWRSRMPVIVRSSRQWFINLDESLRRRCLECLKGVEIRPESARAMFENQLTQRPHWCISRQRYWGVPIPVLFSGERPITSRQDILLANVNFVEHVCKLVLDKGPDVWWTATNEELVPDSVRSELKLGSEADLQRGNDIMDIWLDSGLSWRAVLPEPQQSQLYLEGQDQVRGWFQSSLITSVALRDQAPYRQLYMHGFTLDSEGRKMSKSLGNVIDPIKITRGGKNLEKEPAYGVDVLRWWVATHASSNENVAVSTHVIAECQENVAKLRNTLRFCLGALLHFDDRTDALPYDTLLSVDQLMLHLLHRFHFQVTKCMEDMRYNHACATILNFIVNEASSFYFQAVKDRLYCDAEKSVARRSCQTALSHILDSLVFSVAPVLPHLSEEVYYHHASPVRFETGVFRRSWHSPPSEWNQAKLEALEGPLFKLRNVVNKATSKSSPKLYDLNIVSQQGCQFVDLLRVLQPETAAVHSGLTDVLQVASVTFVDDSALPGEYKNEASVVDEGVYAVLMPAKYSTCDRCRRNVSEAEGRLCARCDEVYQQIQLKFD
ncbi:unnamed protein product, partial [Ixodes hexagonus]